MTNPKPARTCACGATFEPEARGQLYCNPCRQVRAQALAALQSTRSKACRRCNSQQDVTRGVCQACRDAQSQADRAKWEARLAKLNAKGGCTQCGSVVTDIYLGAALCRACHNERVKAAREETRRRQRGQNESVGKTDEQLRQWLDARLSRQDDEAYGGRYGYTPGTRSARSMSTEMDTNPEQLDAADQDAVDTAFDDLMKGFEL